MGTHPTSPEGMIQPGNGSEGAAENAVQNQKVVTVWVDPFDKREVIASGTEIEVSTGIVKMFPNGTYEFFGDVYPEEEIFYEVSGGDSWEVELLVIEDLVELVSVKSDTVTDFVSVPEEGTIIKGVYGELMIFPDGAYDYNVDKECKAFRRIRSEVVDTFTYELVQGEKRWESHLEVTVEPYLEANRGSKKMFDLINQQIRKNKATFEEQMKLRKMVAESTGWLPHQIGRADDWGDRLLAVTPDGNRFVAKPKS